MDTIVRPCTAADRPALRELLPRVGEGSPSGRLWGHPESEADIYLFAYVDADPESVLLAESGGRLVGYLAGDLGAGALPAESVRMERAMREHRLMTRPATWGFFARAAMDGLGGFIRRRPSAGELTDPRWPAHLHVNLVPEARGTGAAEMLMRGWFERLREKGVPGCHLQTLVENGRAVRFFTRMGFRPHGPTPLVPGIRHDGRRLHQLTMVRET
ncbi:acetyltransferase (GNAT) family protein [Stackebrandtia albiflava]|uniref:Acetyltransferase (GNAT) family protein n=1 Tax=Stackebrandtia albiflava TaxID=406432 RepID=A0A562V9E1_9ACTN|nr:GNAT family N-acetyltransferase [Stackebrandtia albiflava]TWJ14493.1 acetyltransferase (GNAT) family protein [Stackebrandtia albiflava]